MIFVDETKIYVKAGNGGKGCESHHKDRSNRHLIPSGGDGGHGGDIICRASRGVQTLLDFRYQQHYKAKKGTNGGSRGKRGKNGESSILRVPVGTLIRDLENDLLIKDLSEDGQEVVVARGGAGGVGNEGKKDIKLPKEGQERTLKLELKLVADVGLVGFPNAGKSTIICAISKVKSKIANYPFTTRSPILGFVPGDAFGGSTALTINSDESEEIDFVVADLPGIIEGAHKGKGLGDRFLRHTERTRILVHVIDMAGTEMRDPVDDYEKIAHELNAYSEKLNVKHKIIVANKMDLPEAAEHLANFKKKYKSEIFEVSAVENLGLKELVEHIRETLCQENFQER